MHIYESDAEAAAKELEKPPATMAVLPSVEQFAVKLEYQFTPAFFQGDFWLDVAQEMNLTRRKHSRRCGQGHVLLLRMRERYRQLRDFSDPQKRKLLEAEELETRRKESYKFCMAIVHASRIKPKNRM